MNWRELIKAYLRQPDSLLLGNSQKISIERTEFMKGIGFFSVLLLVSATLVGCGGGSTGAGYKDPYDDSGGRFGTVITKEELSQLTQARELSYSLDPVRGPDCSGADRIDGGSSKKALDGSVYIGVTCHWFCVNYKNRKEVHVRLIFFSPKASGVNPSDEWIQTREEILAWVANCPAGMPDSV